MAPEPPGSPEPPVSPEQHSARDREPVEIPIEDALDLHAFRPADVRSVVDEYLIAAHAKGFTEVRLIHGRGIGVQRALVRSLLDTHPLVAAYADAPADRGGWGATLVRLRQPADRPAP